MKWNNPFLTVSGWLLFALSSFAPPLVTADDVVYHALFDPKTNMDLAYIPLPKGWTVVKNRQSPEDPSYTGPGGIKVLEFGPQMFTYTSDPYMQQMYSAAGQQMRVPPSVEQLFEQDIVPLARDSGSQLVKKYRIPELAQKNHQYSNLLYSVAPTQKNFETLASEWKDNEGIHSLIILNYSVLSSSMGLVNWYYTGTLLEAPAAQFKKARKSWIEALLNLRYNPQQIEAHNRSQMQQAQTSQSAHQARMQANQRAFQNTQRAITDANNAASDASMSAWRYNNAASDRMQHQSINSIHDEETVYNPGTGNTYQVDSGANQYWMNNDGQYLPSNDLFYNPNMDPNTNYQEWNEAEIIR